jgi:hypothetical protein
MITPALSLVSGVPAKKMVRLSTDTENVDLDVVEEYFIGSNVNKRPGVAEGKTVTLITLFARSAFREAARGHPL